MNQQTCSPSSIDLHLLDGPFVRIDERTISVPHGCRGVLVHLALHGAVGDNGVPLGRARVAGDLWPDADEERAAGNLRTVIWRLRGAGIDVLVADEGLIRINPQVVLDLHRVEGLARQIIRASTVSLELEREFLLNVSAAIDLLPGWYADWVVTERQRLRHHVLDAVDTLCVHFSRVGRCAEAIDLALTAISTDSLRESSCRALITAHLCEGNVDEARRAYVSYRTSLDVELGVSPSPELAELVASRVSLAAMS